MGCWALSDVLVVIEQERALRPWMCMNMLSDSSVRPFEHHREERSFHGTLRPVNLERLDAIEANKS